MRGDVPPFSSTPSWRGSLLQHRDKFTFIFLRLPFFCKSYSALSYSMSYSSMCLDPVLVLPVSKHERFTERCPVSTIHSVKRLVTLMGTIIYGNWGKHPANEESLLIFRGQIC
jgi:hypothetical protein